MDTRSIKHPGPECLPTVRAIVRAWRADRSISDSSARRYLGWISRFRRYCAQLDLSELDELTYQGARRFKTWCARTPKIEQGRLENASALRALRRVYQVNGTPLPAWRAIDRHPPPASVVLREYATHLARHRGNPQTTVHKKLDHIGKLLDHLAASGKSWRQMRLPDIDALLIQCAHDYSRTTTADMASTVRSFARFLLASGRIDIDLADAVISPVQPRFERPRRAWLPWEDIQRLLRAVDTSTARGLRDHALLLLMSTYGLGAGEVIRLQLQDIDWNAGALQVTRPKTGVNFVLPLLPAVGKVLARYLRHGRPSHTATRHVFVQMKVPFGALTGSSAVRHILVKHAKVAGIQAAHLGSHVLRHSNAARQIDVGTKARVLTELLGHRDSQSLSAYVRIATQPLRGVSLPVPR